MRRAARSLDPERTLFVVTRAHERYYSDELADVRPRQVLIQPDNKGTAPAILLSLLHLRSLDPGASVVFLPSDHHYADEYGFLAAVHRAFEVAEERARRPILLGASPTHPETGYGWIEPGPLVETAARTRLFRVMRFWEKPSPPAARMLLNLGCLWNTFVMVGRVSAFLDMLQTATPHLYDKFERHETAPGHFDSERLYETLDPVDFSRDVLARSPVELAVMNTGPVGWSDLSRWGVAAPQPSSRQPVRRRRALWCPAERSSLEVGPSSVYRSDLAEQTSGLYIQSRGGG